MIRRFFYIKWVVGLDFKCFWGLYYDVFGESRITVHKIIIDCIQLWEKFYTSCLNFCMINQYFTVTLAMIIYIWVYSLGDYTG